MNIDQLSGKRFEIALERFEQRKASLDYKGISFFQDGDKLSVNSYSDYLLENTTREMAIDKIEYSKVVLKEILDSVPSFRDIIKNLEPEYAFCYDYHKGAVAIAIESGGELNWLMESK